MADPKNRRVFAATLLVAAASVLFGTGCANVLYRTPAVVTGEERLDENVIEEKVEIRFEKDETPLSAVLDITPVTVRRVECRWSPVVRDWGYYIPFDPLVELVDWLSLPVLLIDGIVRLYLHMTYDDDTGGIGEGRWTPYPGDPTATESVQWRLLASNLDDAVRPPDWWVHAGEVLYPAWNSRYVFRSARTRFGPIGDCHATEWKRGVREEISPLKDTPPEILVDGKVVARGFRLDLLSLGPGPAVVEARLPGPDGKEISGRLEVTAAYLTAVRSAAALRQILEKSPSAHEARFDLAELYARFEAPCAAIAQVEAAMAAGASREEAARRLERLYLLAARKAYREENVKEAFFLDALAEFHTEILSGAWRNWNVWFRKPRRRLVEGLGSVSFLERARTAAILAETEELSNEERSAGLLALLCHETDPLVRWACLWALERCGTRDAGKVAKALSIQEANDVLRARAGRTAEVRER